MPERLPVGHDEILALCAAADLIEVVYFKQRGCFPQTSPAIFSSNLPKVGSNVSSFVLIVQ